MLEIILVRHGQTDWNRDRRIMGHRPIPLNSTGKKESGLLAKALVDVDIDAIYTSPLMRAFQTARILSSGRNVKLEKSSEIAEIDYGQWVGRTFEEVSQEKSFRVYHTNPRHAQAPGGEKMTSVAKRAVGFIEKIRKEHKKGRVLVVSHADVIKVILVNYLGIDLNEILRLRIDNSSLSLLWFKEKRARVMAVNCVPSIGLLFQGGDQLYGKKKQDR